MTLRLKHSPDPNRNTQKVNHSCSSTNTIIKQMSRAPAVTRFWPRRWPHLCVLSETRSSPKIKSEERSHCTPTSHWSPGPYRSCPSTESGRHSNERRRQGRHYPSFHNKLNNILANQLPHGPLISRHEHNTTQADVTLPLAMRSDTIGTDTAKSPRQTEA